MLGIVFTTNEHSKAKARTPRPPLLSLGYSRYGTRSALRVIPALSLPITRACDAALTVAKCAA